MNDLATALKSIAVQPLVPWLILGVITIFVAIDQAGKRMPENGLHRLKKSFGAERWSDGLFVSVCLLWTVPAALIVGIFVFVITDMARLAFEGKEKSGDEFRFLATKGTAVTLALGAVVAFPFTAMRLHLTREQGAHEKDVLYNDKLHNAITDMHARYQKTVAEGGTPHDIWEDDIMRRVGAIDRLEALVVERPEMAPRIARTLCVYLKEMTREHPARPYPKDGTDDEIKTWRDAIRSRKRTDMEAAAQVLGRLQKHLGLNPNEDRSKYKALGINLFGVNLQSMELSGLDFSYTNLNEVCACDANLTGVFLLNPHLGKRTSASEISRQQSTIGHISIS